MGYNAYLNADFTMAQTCELVFEAQSCDLLRRNVKPLFKTVLRKED